MDACAAMNAWSPGIPVPPTRAKSADPQWTPGEMYELESQFSDDESDVDPALKVSCNQQHLEECDQCESLKTTMLPVLLEIESPYISFYSSEQKEDLLLDGSHVQDMVFKWKVFGKG